MKHFLAGLGFGVVAGLLLAPKRGELTRADVRNAAQRVTNDVYDAIASRFRRAESQSSGRKPSGSATGLEGAEVKDAAVEALNLASREALIAVHGIGQVLADRIIENRPYERAYDVVEKGILPESTFLELRRALLDKSA